VGAHLPKILDFGIAKLLTTQTGRVLTQAGAVLGSLEYMSPEQAEGKAEVGEQTDVWGLSVVLYELITGRRPFTGATLTAILFSLLTRDPTPTTDLAAGDEDLWRIIARGLRRSPAERWPDMRAFGTALASWAVQRGITTDATGTSLTHHWLAPGGHAGVRPVSAVMPSVDPADPAGLGTLETTYVAAVKPPLRQARAILAAAVVALVAAPALFAAGLYARRADGSASPGAPAPLTVIAARGALSGASAAIPLDGAPEPAPAPEAAAATSALPVAPPAPRSPGRRPAPATRPRVASTAMPLPAAPNF